MSVRVAIVDDHRVFREGLRAVLDGRDGLAVVAEYGDAADALAGLPGDAADVVLMDLSLPGLGGVEATRRLVASAPRPRVLVLSMLDDRATVLAALDAGAAGYVTKASALGDIVRAVHAVDAGHLVMGDEAARHLVAAGLGRPDDRFTARERELLPLLADALPTGRMATRLGISEKTVRNYLSALYAKLGAEDRAAAALAARRALGR